ncbi:hypothetical protein NZK32_08875 [Cyanobium sp. FGCU-52]|nr:hypothetical protein [Cyanobium sp. FGCU52]
MLGSSFLSCRFAGSESRRLQAKLAHHLFQAGGAPGQLSGEDSGEELREALRLLEERA